MPPVLLLLCLMCLQAISPFLHAHEHEHHAQAVTGLHIHLDESDHRTGMPDSLDIQDVHPVADHPIVITAMDAGSPKPARTKILTERGDGLPRYAAGHSPPPPAASPPVFFDLPLAYFPSRPVTPGRPRDPPFA